MSKKDKKDKETFMNLMTDFAFKHIFGSVHRKHILIQFLNILFEKEGLNVYDVTYHDKEALPERIDGKVIKYDVYCTSPKEKEHFIVEMQRVYHPGFEDRTVLYAVRASAGQLKRGQKYKLSPVYSIFLVNFHMPGLKKRELHDVRLMDINTHEIFSDVLRLLFVSLADAKMKWEDCETKYEKIVFIIKNMHLMDKESKAYKSGEFDDMFNEAELENMAAEDVVAYSESKLRYEDDLAALEYRYDQGKEEGMKEGMKEGRMEGKDEAFRMTARKLLEAGMDPNFINQITGIPIPEILRLKAKE